MVVKELEDGGKVMRKVGWRRVGEKEGKDEVGWFPGS